MKIKDNKICRNCGVEIEFDDDITYKKYGWVGKTVNIHGHILYCRVAETGNNKHQIINHEPLTNLDYLERKYNEQQATNNK